MEAALDPLEPERQRVIDLAREQRLVELIWRQPASTSASISLTVAEVGEARPVAVMAIGRRVHDRQRPGSELRFRADGCEAAKSFGCRAPVADGAPDRRKIGFIGAVAKHPVFQLVEIEAGQMAQHMDTRRTSPSVRMSTPASTWRPTSPAARTNSASSASEMVKPNTARHRESIVPLSRAGRTSRGSEDSRVSERTR